jgi:hypothetical protein
MKDLSNYALRVISDRNASLDVPSEIPRDVEGTVLCLTSHSLYADLQLKRGNYSVLLSECSTAVVVVVRWDNDTKCSVNLSSLKFRSLGSLPLYDSIWDAGIKTLGSKYISALIDNRPYHELRPFTKRFIDLTYTTISAPAYQQVEIAYEDVPDIVDTAPPPPPKPAKVYYTTTTATLDTSWASTTGNYYGTY